MVVEVPDAFTGEMRDGLANAWWSRVCDRAEDDGERPSAVDNLDVCLKCQGKYDETEKIQRDLQLLQLLFGLDEELGVGVRERVQRLAPRRSMTFIATGRTHDTRRQAHMAHHFRRLPRCGSWGMLLLTVLVLPPLPNPLPHSCSAPILYVISLPTPWPGVGKLIALSRDGPRGVAAGHAGHAMWLHELSHEPSHDLSHTPRSNTPVASVSNTLATR